MAEQIHGKEACAQAKCLFVNALTANFLSSALTTNSSSRSCSSKVLSCSDKILSTCASCHVPKDYRHLYCLRSFS